MCYWEACIRIKKLDTLASFIARYKSKGLFKRWGKNWLKRDDSGSNETIALKRNPNALMFKQLV